MKDILNRFPVVQRIVLVFFVISVLISFIPVVEAAAPKFIIKPMVTVSGRWESNFFKTENNEREVFTYLLQPGIQLGVETAKLKVLFNYTMEAYFYDDSSDVPAGERPADDLDYIGHLAALNITYTPFDRLTLGLNDSFYRTRYPTAYDRLSDSIERDQYDINRLTPMIFYDFENRFSAGLRYVRTDIKYSETESNDSTEHRGILNLLYDPTRTITFDFEYQHWMLGYELDDDIDYHSDQIKLIFQKRYKYYAFDLGVGYHMRDFENPAMEDADTFAYKVAILGQNPAPPEGRRHLGQVFVRTKSHFYLAAERNFNNYGANYTANRFTLDVGHVFLHKIEARVKGYYQMSDYETALGLTPAGNLETRDDDTYNISGSLAYLFTERLDLSLTAGFEDRNSNLAGQDYENKYVILRLNFNFDFKSRGGFTEESLYY